ncbi:MAG: hypothetical protein QOH86_1384 [Sphingomonadales bacterium]|jgi:hypothetical protein|nr:hypothetical protein [Sphingomonadales bacterium]
MKGALILVGFVAGCARADAPPSFDYVSKDEPDRERVHLIFRNESHGALCLSPSEWPNPGGTIHYGSTRLFLVVEGRRYPIRDFNTGSCIAGCRTRVARGTSLDGFVPYSEFDLPRELWSRPKSLEFSPRPYRCRESAR